MGYFLQAIICKQGDKNKFISKFEHAHAVQLKQGLCLIPMTEELFDEVNNFVVSPEIDQFYYLSQNLEQQIINHFGQTSYAYVEADYHGGDGGQLACFWQEGQLCYRLDFGEDRINEVLRSFGVEADKGFDEFDTLRLGRHRFTEDWVSS